MPKNSDKITWLVVGILVSLAAWGLKEVYGTTKERIVSVENENSLQNTILSRFNTDKAIDLQWKIAVAKNIEAIMDEMEIPESRRAYVEPDTAGGR